MPRAISASASCCVAAASFGGDVRIQRTELRQRMELEAAAGEVAVDEPVVADDVRLRRGRPVLREVVVIRLQLPEQRGARGAVSLPTNGVSSESATAIRPPRSGGSPRTSDAARRISARYAAADDESIFPEAAARLTASSACFWPGTTEVAGAAAASNSAATVAAARTSVRPRT